MPSTFTTNTGIEKPGDGEQAGVWGRTANTNFDIIDRALTGSATISLAGLVSYTLTTSSAVLSDGHYAAITFTGSPLGEVTVVIAPASAQKIYIIRNATDQALTFAQGSGANATIPAGEAGIIISSGTGATASVYEVMRSVTTGVPTNTPNATVRRDGSGNFAANRVTANLTGNVTGNVTGDLTGNVTGDLIGDVTGNVTGSISGPITNALSLSGNKITNLATGTANSDAANVGQTQPRNAALTSIAALSTSADQMLYLTGANTYETVASSPFGRGLLGTANEATARSTLDAVSRSGDVLNGGYTITAPNDGTKSSGTYTPSPSTGNLRRITNGGAFTLAAPTASGDYTMIVHMVNNSNAGTVTFSSFDLVDGANLTTTNNDKFRLQITKLGNSVDLNIRALQ